MVEPLCALKVADWACFCMYDTAPAKTRYRDHDEVDYGDLHVQSPASTRRPSLRGIIGAKGQPPQEDKDEAEPSTASSLHERAGLSQDGRRSPSARSTPERSTPGRHVLEETPAPLDAIPESRELPIERPDFTGTWIMDAFEGDMDAFLKEIGMSWAMRTLASSMNYGVGKVTNDISHFGDKLKIVSWSPKGTFTSDFTLDGKEHETVDPIEGRPILATAQWTSAGDRVHIEVRRLECGEVLPSSDRFMAGDKLCLEQVSRSGLTVRRLFARQ
mmetsp:Transcript_28990/g.73571  ORF Transcript_28990/g.73571 Transcript_28990/m.73571 type:complete len:273 (+) Transcript_28990:63-881(+)